MDELKSKNKNEIIALANTDNTPKEVLDIYKKIKFPKQLKCLVR